MIFNSIKWRLQAWHTLILVAVLSGFGFTAYQVARDNQLRRVDQDLEQQLMSLFRPDRFEPPPGQRPGPPAGERDPGFDPGPGQAGPNLPRFEPRGGFRRGEDFLARVKKSIETLKSLESGLTNAVYFLLWQRDGKLVASSAGAPAKVASPENRQIFESPEPQGAEADAASPRFRPGPPEPPVARSRGEFRELFRFLPGGGCVLVGRSMAPDLAAMHRLALWLFMAGAGVLLLGLAGGWWLATRAIEPIDAISNTAQKIAGGDLAQRISVADTESELGRLAQVLNSTFARLESAFAHQARFTSDASHELRTPVSVILTQAQSALSRERSGSEYREALEACLRAAQRMRRLTESLLELARLDAGQEPMKRERIDLAGVVRDCVELVRPLAAERGVEIVAELPPAHCLGDAERLSQVATNLLSNAIQFNHPQGRVRVATRLENGTAVLTVADTGEGIPAEDLPHIFERFYRVDKSRSHTQGRTGLGLAISKAILDAHNGTIEVSSQPGGGATFMVRLPAK